MSAGPLLDFDAAADAGAALAGGKGATLGRLRRYGLPVPAGFVVTTAAGADFFDADLRAAATAAGSDADA
ncbi:MAG TPA: PEP/pyruvate-binding domain-containing protein, partial [Azospira sp.]|nr:PEP/pyruvate-binding domain-containing protein [Azospira sp.]